MKQNLPISNIGDPVIRKFVQQLNQTGVSQFEENDYLAPGFSSPSIPIATVFSDDPAYALGNFKLSKQNFLAIWGRNLLNEKILTDLLEHRVLLPLSTPELRKLDPSSTSPERANNFKSVVILEVTRSRYESILDQPGLLIAGFAGAQENSTQITLPLWEKVVSGETVSVTLGMPINVSDDVCQSIHLFTILPTKLVLNQCLSLLQRLINSSLQKSLPKPPQRKFARRLLEEQADTIRMSDDSDDSDPKESPNAMSKRQSHFQEIQSRFQSLPDALFCPVAKPKLASLPHLVSERLNSQQQQTVAMAVSGPPYLVCLGPPGSGKTDMVAYCALAMFEEIQQSPLSYTAHTILITTPMNSSTDVITERIVKLLPKLKIFPKILRLSSRSRKERFPVPESIASFIRFWEFSSDEQGSSASPELGKAIATADIIIATVDTAMIRFSSLLDLTCGFRYLIIDEAGLVSAPLGAFLSTLSRSTFACGDFLQLKPHVTQQTSYIALAQHWNISFLRFLYDVGHPSTQLAQNYRSRDTTIAAINHTLYGDKIVTVNTDKLESRIPNKPILRSLFPQTKGISVVPTKGFALQPMGSTSFANLAETFYAHQIILRFHTESVQQSLAILSPYKPQIALLSNLVADSKAKHLLAADTPWLHLMC
ncbi:MAG: AAA domain-containing protein, partial [Pseudomonadota bacterium]